MGIDCRVYVRTSDKLPPDAETLGDWVDIMTTCDVDPPRATHIVDIPGRYYDETYCNGSWQHICPVLMTLIRAPNVERVWYGPDTVTEGELPPVCSIQRVLDICRYYMNGEYWDNANERD